MTTVVDLEDPITERETTESRTTRFLRIAERYLSGLGIFSAGTGGTEDDDYEDDEIEICEEELETLRENARQFLSVALSDDVFLGKVRKLLCKATKTYSSRMEILEYVCRKSVSELWPRDALMQGRYSPLIDSCEAYVRLSDVEMVAPFENSSLEVWPLYFTVLEWCGTPVDGAVFSVVSNQDYMNEYGVSVDEGGEVAISTLEDEDEQQCIRCSALAYYAQKIDIDKFIVKTDISSRILRAHPGVELLCLAFGLPYARLNDHMRIKNENAYTLIDVCSESFLSNLNLRDFKLGLHNWRSEEFKLPEVTLRVRLEFVVR